MQHRWLVAAFEEKRDRSARLLQSVGGEVGGVGGERSDLRVGDLRDEVVDFLVVAARFERFGERPVLVFFSEFDFTRGGLHRELADLRGGDAGEPVVAEIVRLFRELGFQIMPDDVDDI